MGEPGFSLRTKGPAAVTMAGMSAHLLVPRHASRRWWGGRALAAVAVAGSAAAAGGPLLRDHPFPWAWAVAVAACYGLAGYECGTRGRPVAGGWLVACGLLWAGSLAAAWRSGAGPALACWIVLWATLGGGALVITRTASWEPGRSGPAVPGEPGNSHPVRLPRLALRMVPLAAGSTAALGLLSALAGSWANWWWPGPARPDWALAAQGACAALVPLTVLVSVALQRAGRAAVSALLARLTAPVTAQSVQQALREALADPTALVLFPMPDGSGLVLADGEPAGPPADTPGRLVFRTPETNPGDAALLTVADAGDVDRGRVEQALLAAGPALQNARLQAALHSQLRTARDSRAAIVRTALQERRSLARDLHDGAQQYLHALSANLALARQQAEQADTLAAIDAARDRLRSALAKLRGLGRDLYPAELETAGLAAALESLVDDGPVDVSVTVSAGRYAPEMEIVAYLTIRETLEALARHGAATRADSRVTASEGRLTMFVHSDGQLDAAGSSGWVSVIRDRVQAVGGELNVGTVDEPAAGSSAITEPESPRRQIWIEAWIPCA